MEKILGDLITVVFTGGLFTIYLFIGVVIALLIQLISYQVFNFNLFKFLDYHLFVKQGVKTNLKWK